MRNELDALPSADELGLSQLVHLAEAISTMDIAHQLAAAGAPAGTLVIADRQLRGRGRGGKVWQSERGAGVWMTLLERPRDQHVVGVLALRLGLALADALAPLVNEPPTVKWPNDVYVGTGKISGVLVEARWRDTTLDWVAIGVGINMRVPQAVAESAAVRPDTSIATVLRRVVPRLREAAQQNGVLTSEERQAWDARDMARGRRISAPCRGVVQGIDLDGALLVLTHADQPPRAVHAGSLVFDTRATRWETPC